MIGEVFAAGEIATIMAIGGFLEEYTVSKTQGRIEELVKMTPQVATRIKNGIEERIPVEKVQVGDMLKVLPGESIPTDGVIVKGKTSINQSTLTGESLPVDKKENDEVFSGTTNLYGSFTMKTTKISQESSFQKLIKLVESSEPENSRIRNKQIRYNLSRILPMCTGSGDTNSNNGCHRKPYPAWNSCKGRRIS